MGCPKSHRLPRLWPHLIQADSSNQLLQAGGIYNSNSSSGNLHLASLPVKFAFETKYNNAK